MNAAYIPHVVTALDVGTTKICVLIAHIAPDGSYKIVGVGQAPSEGLARGMIVQMAPAVRAIQTALKEAEAMSGISINSASIGISGSHIRSYISHGMITIPHAVIRETDVAQVVQAAQAVTLPEGQQLLHALPHYFCINGTELVQDPCGLAGARLEARVHLITGAVASVHNVMRSCELAGITHQQIILEPIASATSVLSHDERELGAGILDIGGGTADFAIYQRNAVCHTHIIPIAGNLFTTDLAMCLRISRTDAERIKKQFGCADATLVTQTEPIIVSQIDGITTGAITQAEICAIIEPRAEELLCLLAEHIETHKLRPFMAAGLVLTGGGALLNGLCEKARAILRLPVRIGRPLMVPSDIPFLSNPAYATCHGLLLYTKEQEQKRFRIADATSPLTRVLHIMKSWVCDIF